MCCVCITFEVIFLSSLFFSKFLRPTPLQNTIKNFLVILNLAFENIMPHSIGWISISKKNPMKFTSKDKYGSKIFCNVWSPDQNPFVVFIYVKLLDNTSQIWIEMFFWNIYRAMQWGWKNIFPWFWAVLCQEKLL